MIRPTILFHSIEFKDSPDGTRVSRSDRRAYRDYILSLLLTQQVTAKFDIPGVAKEDMNVTYHPFPARLEVSWKSVKVTEREIDEGMTVRDVEERTVCRTIPLPEGTRVSFLFRVCRFILSREERASSQFDEIEAKLLRRLELTYPKMHATRAKSRTPTPQRRGLTRHGGSESRTLDAW
jgi:hypothetical protein